MCPPPPANVVRARYTAVRGREGDEEAVEELQSKDVGTLEFLLQTVRTCVIIMSHWNALPHVGIKWQR